MQLAYQAIGHGLDYLFTLLNNGYSPVIMNMVTDIHTLP